MKLEESHGAEIGGAFVRRVVWRQGLVGVVAFMIVALLAPWSLMLESPGLAQLWLTCLEVGAFAVAATILLSSPRMRRARQVVRLAALEPERVSPEDIGALADLPFALTARFVIVGAVAATLMGVPEIRPEGLGQAHAIILGLLTFTIVCASAVVHYVTIRDATIRAIDLSPLEPITAWLESESLRLAPRRRVARKILFAVVAPVALVGVGTLLVAQAQLRAFVEKDRSATATQLVHTALDPLPEALAEAGREDAVAAAAAHGFLVQRHRGTLSAPVQPERLPGGQVRTTLELEEGHASVRYTVALASEVVNTSIWIALVAVLLAALLGAAFGRMLATDLVLATEQVSTLGTDAVLRGDVNLAARARFAVVAQLGRSVEALAERFREFAAAQERALQVKASAGRMKQLLFASVSHDLKSPLNSILGFAELVREEPLSQSQLESLELVSSRGRELLALIETILDAARVEAGQLQLMLQPIPASELMNDALSKARDLHGQPNAEMIVELARDMPPLAADPAYASRAVAVLIAHSMDIAGPVRRHALRVRGALSASSEDVQAMALLHIEYEVAGDRASLLESQLRGKIHQGTGRGAALRLSLARSIIELHGGAVEFERGAHGTSIVTCRLPISDRPSLGPSSPSLAARPSAPRQEEPTLVMYDPARDQLSSDPDGPTLVMPSKRRDRD